MSLDLASQVLLYLKCHPDVHLGKEITDNSHPVLRLVAANPDIVTPVDATLNITKVGEQQVLTVMTVKATIKGKDMIFKSSPWNWIGYDKKAGKGEVKGKLYVALERPVNHPQAKAFIQEYRPKSDGRSILIDFWTDDVNNDVTNDQITGLFKSDAFDSGDEKNEKGTWENKPCCP